MAPTNPDRMLGFVIHEVARLLRRRFEQYTRAEALGLTRAQCAVLAHLARQEGINQATLAQTMDIEPITLVRLLDRLEELGYVQRKPDPGDRRAYVLALTPKVRPMLERIYDLAGKVYDEALAGLSKADTARLLEQLSQMKGNLLSRTAEEAVSAATARRKRRA
jgi:MarR family transcriptional regulator, transcriptional regulator for hemolysin